MRRAARSQARQRSQSGELGAPRLRVERRVSRGESDVWGLGCSGAGSGRVEEEVSKGTPSREVTVQPSGVISTNWPSGLARSRRIFSGVGKGPRERVEKVRWPRDWAETVIKARPPTAVKGMPRSAMARRAWKPDGPRGLGGVRTRRLSISTYSIEGGGVTACGAVNN